ncbi:protein SON isoform X2 [Parambassis ranga]|uniref:Protein SON isoform X2 n=1 Tax=Parambassis ranga TaxID=210632 RepID=A0A6P7I0Z3_9TELE|nr:protein SON-like isoform X2 [Parambassis ranga]
MAANIEQIFQDFILNKIREIEDQNEDKTAPEGAGGEDKVTSDRDKQEDFRSTQKKHKKHKKHKSKKKKRNREEESSSESGAELERGAKNQLRPLSSGVKKEPGEDCETKSRCRKQHSSGKKKKKKKKRKGEENSSDSDASMSKQRDSKCGQSTSLRGQEELPDIIPKQDSSNKGREDEDRHSYLQSHSCSSRRKSRSRSGQRRQRSRTPSRSSSSEKRKDLKESTPQPALGSTQQAKNIQTRSASPEKPGETKEEKQGSSASQSISTESQHITQGKAYEHLRSPARSPADQKKRRKQSKSPHRSRERKSSKRQKRSKSASRRYRRGSRSRSPSQRKRSRSRSRGRKLRRSRSLSASRSRRRVTYSQRDRWKREPSHSPVLILRKNRSPSRKHGSSSTSPQRISELDKEQLLEIAKANAAAMCAKVGMPIPASLRSTVLPLGLPNMAMNAAMASMTAATVTAALSNMGTLTSLLPLPSITNKPPPAAAAAASQPNITALDEVKRKVAKQANSISIKEFTDKCKMIVDSTGELPVAAPHVSDEEDEGKPFGGSAAAIREQKVISFNINNTMVRPAARSDAGIAKEFPVSSGSQHRKKEGEALGAYGEWVPVDKMKEKAPVTSVKTLMDVSMTMATSSSLLSSWETAACTVPAEAADQSVFVTDNDNVFPDPSQQAVDITQAVAERIKAQRRLAENPYDISAICMLNRAQEQVDAWAQSNTVPGLFTGSTGAQVLSSEELSNSGPQAWLKKDQFLRAAPVSGGVGEFLMRKMGWKTGEGLGRNREGTVEPIVIDFKVDRKGLVAEGEKPQKQTGGLVVTKDLMGKHPVSALIELCNKRRIMQPDFIMVHHSGPDHRKNFLFKVTVDSVDYQPQTPSPNKKHAKAMAATVALQALGEVPVDGPGLYTGPVFTAASTGPLFST